MTFNVKCFDSSMAGAPVLTGQPGSLINVLDACLVNGLNSKTVQSLTRSGSVVTATFAAGHGYTLQPVAPWLRISGANETDYNGEWRVVSIPNSTTLTFDIGAATPPSPATGTITSVRAPLAWLKSFGNASVAAYRQPPGSNQRYLRVSDAGSGNEARVARVIGYEQMSSIDESDSPRFPTALQRGSNELSWHKSVSNDSTARPWQIIGDNRCFWLLIETRSNSALYDFSFFGDVTPYKAGDVFCSALFGSSDSDPTAPYYKFARNRSPTNFGGENFSNCYLARSYSQLGGAVPCGMFAIFQEQQDNRNLFGRSNTVPFPNPVDNGLYLLPGYLTGIGQYLRGAMPGIFFDPHGEDAFAHGDIVRDITGLEGRALCAKRLLASDFNASGRAWFDLSGPWS